MDPQTMFEIVQVVLFFKSQTPKNLSLSQLYQASARSGLLRSWQLKCLTVG